MNSGFSRDPSVVLQKLSSAVCAHLATKALLPCLAPETTKGILGLSVTRQPARHQLHRIILFVYTTVT